eukprot:351431-Chlamydomonas_euryale.AAC.2
MGGSNPSVRTHPKSPPDCLRCVVSIKLTDSHRLETMRGQRGTWLGSMRIASCAACPDCSVAWPVEEGGPMEKVQLSQGRKIQDPTRMWHIEFDLGHTAQGQRSNGQRYTQLQQKMSGTDLHAGFALPAGLSCLSARIMFLQHNTHLYPDITFTLTRIRAHLDLPNASSTTTLTPLGPPPLHS